ncbi:hypothetical protein C2E23DRAFT_742194 [Lenzites betulinus]|nr:hypothetical protein C2E23DRAFT_742194 [Lenzites betulinus]
MSRKLIHYSQLLPINGGLIEGNYTLLASTFLFYYDYLITLPTEVRVFWTSRWNLASVYFFLIRYGFFLDITILALGNIRFTPNAGLHESARTCGLLLDIGIAFSFLNFVVVAAFVATRMYAIWGCSKRVGVLVFLLGLINPNAITPMLVFGMTRVVMSPWPVWGCESFIQDYNDKYIAFSHLTAVPIIVSSIGIVYELLCLLMTVYKTISVYRLRRRSGHPGAALTTLLLRDGSLYFIVMAVLSLVNIVAAAIPSVPSNVQLNAVFGRALTPILTTRFIAHLQEINNEDTVDHSTIHFTTHPHRTRVFTSIGGPISFLEDDDVPRPARRERQMFVEDTESDRQINQDVHSIL